MKRVSEERLLVESKKRRAGGWSKELRKLNVAGRYVCRRSGREGQGHFWLSRRLEIGKGGKLGCDKPAMRLG